MATKKSMWVPFGILMISAWVLGSAIQAGSEMLKLQDSNVVTTSQQFPIGNVEGASITFFVRDGLFVSENGELGSTKTIVASQWIPGKSTLFFLGHIMYICGDGSTIVGTLQPGSSSPDPEGKVGKIQKASGELTFGSGRFKGIKGSQSMTGRILKPGKGEISGKAYNEFILTYTLSP